MNRLKKSLALFSLTLILSLSAANQAEAKFWGNESGEIVAYENGTICTTTTYYVLWIAVSSETVCSPCC